MNNIVLGLVFSVICLNLSFGQELPVGQKMWNSNDKLALEDFKIRINNENTEVVYSQFMITHAIGGLDFMKRNLNQKISNIFMGNASWIDTTKVESMEHQIEFQQMQFDIAEIQARKFRKRILQDKGQLAKGFDIVNQINNEIMAEFSEIRLEMMRGTESGRNERKIEDWKERIAEELKELDEFRFENKNKIKLP